MNIREAVPNFRIDDIDTGSVFKRVHEGDAPCYYMKLDPSMKTAFGVNTVNLSTGELCNISNLVRIIPIAGSKLVFGPSGGKIIC